jgi:DNA-binding transcriptional MerR regulator
MHIRQYVDLDTQVSPASADELLELTQAPVRTDIEPYLYEHYVTDSGKTVSFRTSDIHILLQAERMLERGMSPVAIESMIEKMKQSLQRMDKPMPEATDEVLMKFIKSRYIQSPTDLQKWSESLDNTVEQMTSEFRDYYEQLQSEQNESNSSSLDSTPVE